MHKRPLVTVKVLTEQWGDLGPPPISLDDGALWIGRRVVKAERVDEGRCDAEEVTVFAGEADVGEGVDHFEYRGRSRSSRGHDEYVASVAGSTGGGVLTCGVGTPR